MLRAFDPAQGCVTDAPATIKLWYNDEHALTLGVRRVVVKSSTGTTTTDYPVSPMGTNPGHAASPQVGTTATTGDQAGTDTNTCAQADCGRPMWPSLFITDITTDRTSRAGDWQFGGTPNAPDDVFGTWKAAVRTVDKTKSPATVAVTPDADPAKNNWNLGAGSDPAPTGLTNEGYGAEVRWNLSSLRVNGQPLQAGHLYRFQFMVHDGDQSKTGGDTGQACVNVRMPGSASLAVPGSTLVAGNGGGGAPVPDRPKWRMLLAAFFRKTAQVLVSLAP